MRSDLDHLPANKRRELERVLQLVFEEFEDAFALTKHEWKKKGRILKVILYGSYARGSWVDEPHTAKGYKSDYGPADHRQRPAADRQGQVLGQGR